MFTIRLIITIIKSVYCFYFLTWATNNNNKIVSHLHMNKINVIHVHYNQLMDVPTMTVRLFSTALFETISC